MTVPHGKRLSNGEELTLRLELVDNRADELKSNTRVETLSICTADQPVALGRSLPKFLSNLQTYGRLNCKVVVVDDSKIRENQRLNESLVLLLQKKHAWSTISYVGSTQRYLLVENLAKTTGINLDLLAFALSQKSSLRTLGSARNISHLLSTGGLGIFTDDDTLPLWLKDMSSSNTELLISSSKPVFNSRFSANIKSEWKKITDAAGPIDFCALHETALGRSIPDLIANHSGARMGYCDANAVRSLRSGLASVGLTATGVAGDSGKWSSAGFFVSDDLLTLVNMWCTTADYRAAGHSRLIRRVPPCTQLSRSPTIQAMSYGADLRVVSPPFFPVGRNTDGIFALLFTLVMRDAFIAHLPSAIVHMPRLRQKYEMVYLNAIACLRISDWMGLLLCKSASTVPLAPEEAMLQIGGELQSVGRLRDQEFVRHLRSLVFEHRSNQAAGITAILDTYHGSPQWRSDLALMRQNLLTASLSPSSLIPHELKDLEWLVALKLMKKAISRYGELLCVWPEIVRTCKSPWLKDIGLY
jgi:hypothetical protein